jgi:hypothetical protein
MIVFNLACEHGHLFEGWFASAEAFAEQREARAVRCPVCDSASIERQVSAPRLNLGRAPAESEAGKPQLEDLQRATLSALRAVVESSEDVGTRFAEEARRIHAEQAPDRNIRGTATIEEARALREEGIEVLSVPMADAFKKPMH